MYCKSFGCAGSSLLLRLFSSCGEWQQLFVTMCRLLLAAASLAVDIISPEFGLPQHLSAISVLISYALLIYFVTYHFA